MQNNLDNVTDVLWGDVEVPVPPEEISGLERLGRDRPPRSDRLSIDEAQIKIWARTRAWTLQ